MTGLLTLEKMKALEPLEFCRIYSRHTPDDWGHKNQWNILLSRVLSVSSRTVEGWGDNFKGCPPRYKRELDMIHALTVARQTLEKLGIDPERPDRDSDNSEQK